MAHGGEQRRAHPVSLRQRLGLSGLSAEPVPLERSGRLGGEAVKELGVHRIGLPCHDEREFAPRPHQGRRGVRRRRSRYRHPDPLPVDEFGELGAASPGRGEMVKDRAGGVSSPEHGLRQLEQGSGVLAAPRRLASPPRGQVDHAADRDRDGDEEQQREHVLRVFDRECMHGGREEPVEQHARDHGRRHGRPESADHRHRDHGHQVDQQVIGQAKPALGWDEGSSQQRQYG